jgi:hypothetical protein
MFKALKNTLTNVAKTFWVRPLKTLVILYDDLPNYGSCSLKKISSRRSLRLLGDSLRALRKSGDFLMKSKSWNPMYPCLPIFGHDQTPKSGSFVSLKFL